MRNSDGIWRDPTDREFGVGLGYIVFLNRNEVGSVTQETLFKPTEDDVHKAIENLDIPFDALMSDIYKAKSGGSYGLVIDVNLYRDHLKEIGWL